MLCHLVHVNRNNLQTLFLHFMPHPGKIIGETQQKATSSRSAELHEIMVVVYPFFPKLAKSLRNHRFKMPELIVGKPLKRLKKISVGPFYDRMDGLIGQSD